jgi:hypothetical protein
MKRVLFALHLAALIVMSLVLVGFLGFCAWSVYTLSGKDSLSANLGMVGAVMAGVVIAHLLWLHVVVLRMSLRRHKHWRYTAPIPSALIFLLFGGWFLSGDPGDERMLKIILSIEGFFLLLSGAAALFGERAEKTKDL